MKRPRLSWQPRVKPQPRDCQPEETVSPGRPNLPTLPREIWRKIIAFTVRLAGANSIELDDPFSPPYQHEEYPEVDPGLFEDRRSLARVSSGWRSTVTEMCAEYLAIYSARELKYLVKLLEASEAHKSPSGKRLGEWTTRIDFKILGAYSVPHVIRLLKCTPNLLIYNNKNGPPSSPEKYTPQEVLKALVTFCGSSLRRVEWSGAGEAPRFQDLVQLCNDLPNLVTLRLVAIYSFPMRESDGIPPILLLPKLKTLSLGVIPEPNTPRPEFAVTWDPFLQYASFASGQLPSLERFECDIFPLLTMSFFRVHGHKIRLFRTTAWSAENALPEALGLCPRLYSLVIAQGSETVELPLFHPTLEKICILPTVDVVVGVPQRVFDFAVMAPLDALLKSIEKMTAPHLVELRIRNMGAYLNIVDYATWLGFWWRRWNIRGVHFRDKTGASYQNVQDPSEALLDLVRA
ncbi:hypothetical protein BDZ97DRAFT_1918503 [Flammula alnicola]|nr:hypothetical protein BDZ97DRAFT_1918503 [Flammula alnicola]